MLDPKTPGHAPGVFPLCFGSLKDFQGWQRNARRVTGNTGGMGGEHPYCEDCNRGYQWQMMLAGRCGNLTANPE